ncbi:MAG: YihY/virulence factor BrkB family protein, partial [Actinomycetota bacterium]|nr:YihY/virulence factor BrkB family protein [Actinomycetota bacterium]
RALAAAGAGLSAPQALAALLPASLYGEGLVRAFDRLSDAAPAGARGLRRRLASLALLAVSPLLLLAGLAASRGLTRALGDGLLDRALGVYCAFLVGWRVISVFLLLSYRGIARGGCGARALLWAALSTGSMLSGTCLGFVLFLSLPLDLGPAFGGSVVLAVSAATLGWIYLLHLVVLVGYVLTLRLEARSGHPLRAPTVPDLVRAAA